MERGCVNAYNFLWAAWEYDRLSTIFLCIDPVEGLVLYTYNPYSSVAPRAWKNVGHFKGRSGHPWTLLKQRYRDGKFLRKLFSFFFRLSYKTGKTDVPMILSLIYAIKDTLFDDFYNVVIF